MADEFHSTPVRFTVYVLRSEASRTLYIGQTQDVAKRLLEHNSGLSRYTKGRGPWQLVLQEQFPTRSEAMLRERFLKSGAGRNWLKKRLTQQQQP